MKTLEERREEMSRETWINNVMRIYGWDRKQAENTQRRLELHFMENLIRGESRTTESLPKDEQVKWDEESNFHVLDYKEPTTTIDSFHVTEEDDRTGKELIKETYDKNAVWAETNENTLAKVTALNKFQINTKYGSIDIDLADGEDKINEKLEKLGVQITLKNHE